MKNELDKPTWWEPGSGKLLHKEEREKARANSLIDCARTLENLQQEIHQQHLMNAQLYSNRELAAFDWGTGQLRRASMAPINNTGENLVLSIVDTLVSQVGKQKPKAKPQARGASWRMRRQIRLIDKFLYGEFVRNRVWEIGKKVYRDACIFGFGCAYFTVDEDDRLSVERVFPDEILVDQMEAVACGRFRHVYRRRVLPIEVVAEMFGVDEDDLAASSDASRSYLDYRSVGKGYVVVIEGWQLANGSKSGNYMAACHGKILRERKWTSKSAPFVFYHFQEPLSGFYSPSAVEQVIPYQIRLNEVNEVIRDAQDIMGRPRIFVAEGSRVNPMELDNVVARIIKYTGIKPEPANWGTVDAALYNERDRCWQQCRAQMGISDLAASAAPPPSARYDSAPAFQEFNAIQDDRHADGAQRLERMYLDYAETMIRTIDDHGASPKTTWHSGGKYGGVETIDWDEIDIDKDSYVLTLEATSVYGHGPSAIRDDLEKQFAMGVISPEQYRLERAHPDDTSELSLQAAAAADIRRVIELLETGKYESPTPVQDLVNGVQLVSLAQLNLSQYEDDDPDNKLADIQLNFINWIVEARSILQPPEQPDPGAMEASMGMGPPMDPMMGAPMDPSMGAITGTGSPYGMGAIPVPQSYSGHIS